MSEIDLQTQPGPCVGCGARNYPLSVGGPSICPACDCGDTPNHEGYEKGRRERLQAEVDDEGYETGAVGFWHRRYDTQHRTLHEYEDELTDLRQQLRDLRRRYDQLSEQTGEAIYRAHVMRGGKELDAAKLAEQLDATRWALWSAVLACRAQVERADRNGEAARAFARILRSLDPSIYDGFLVEEILARFPGYSE